MEKQEEALVTVSYSGKEPNTLDAVGVEGFLGLCLWCQRKIGNEDAYQCPRCHATYHRACLDIALSRENGSCARCGSRLVFP